MSDSRQLNILLTKSPARLLWDYSLPAVTGMLVMALYNIVDRIFVGQVVGPQAIAGLTVTFPVMNISTALGVLIGVGASARISIALGQKRTDRAEQVLGNALVMTIIIGISYITGFYFFLEPLLRSFGASDSTLPYAFEFMTWQLPGLLFANLTYSMNNLIRSSGYPKIAMYTMLLGAAVNVILDPVFIYWLDMGIRGAAIATDIAMFISMIFVLRHFFRKDVTVRFKRGIYRLRWHIIWGMITIGAAPSIVNVAGCLINIIINNALLAMGGDNAVAAAGIFTTFTQVLVSVCIGICQGMQPIIGYNYGAGRFDRLRSVYNYAVLAATAIVGTGWLISMIFPGFVPRCFTTDSELCGVASNALHISMFFFWMVGFQIVSTTLFQAIGAAAKSIFLGLTRQVLFLLPMFYLLPKWYGLNGIWYSFPTGDACATVVTILLVWNEFRKMKKLRTDSGTLSGQLSR